MNFLASPTIVTAMAFSGKLSFDPQKDSIELASGKTFKFAPPSGQDLPSEGFSLGDRTYYPTPMPAPQPIVEIAIKKDSQRLEILQPFPSHFGDSNPRGLELPPLKVLLRVRGKCTTDHISAAVWCCFPFKIKYSVNMFYRDHGLNTRVILPIFLKTCVSLQSSFPDCHIT